MQKSCYIDCQQDIAYAIMNMARDKIESVRMTLDIKGNLLGQRRPINIITLLINLHC